MAQITRQTYGFVVGQVFWVCLLFSSTKCAVHFVAPEDPIHEIVAVAASEDTIVLEDGLFRETVIFYGKNLSVGSQFLIDGDSTHISATTIEPDSSRLDTMSCFVYSYGETPASRLIGLTIRNGRGTNWGSANLPMGGGVHVAATDWNSSSVTIEHCHFVDCEAEFGGGLGIGGVQFLYRPIVRVLNCRFGNCIGGYGGGIYALECSLSVVSCMFAGDSAESQGGGMVALSCTLEVVSTGFSNCSSEAALGCWDSFGSIMDCNFANNLSYSMVGVSHLFVTDGRMTISRNVFRNGLLRSTIILGHSNSYFQFIGNVLEDNVSSELAGTILTSERSYGTIAYNIIRNNEFVVGGAIYAYADANCRIHHNLFYGNRSWANDASVLMSASYARPGFDSNWVTGNEGNTISFLPGYPVTIDARNNWWGSPTGPYSPTRNAGGQGDTVLSDSVLFDPWLTTPPDTTMPQSVERGKPAITSTWELAAVYPNPFNAMMTVEIAGFTSGDFTVTLFNILGQEIAELHRGSLTGGRFSYQAPPELASGVYMLRASDRDQARSAKVVLIR